MYVHAYWNGFENVIISTSTEFSTYGFKLVLMKQKDLVWYNYWLSVETDRDKNDAYRRIFQRCFLPAKIKYIPRSKYISEEFATDLCDRPFFSLTVQQGTACWFFNLLLFYYITIGMVYYLSIW